MYQEIRFSSLKGMYIVLEKKLKLNENLRISNINEVIILTQKYILYIT